MERIIEKAKTYKYHSLHYVVPEEPILILDEDGYILMAEKHASKIKIHWACNALDHLIRGLNHLSDQFIGNEITLEFMPPEFIKDFEKEGYQVKCEFADFWIKDLDKCKLEMPNKANIRPLHNEETHTASLITKSCIGLSRGFDGDDEASISSWLNGDDNEIFAAIEDERIVGICMMGTYKNNGAIVAWLRELAVHPDYQRKGIGRSLAEFGLKWGKDKGATQSFLATDVENTPAIKLYNDLGYKQVEDRGEIIIFKHL